MFTVKLSHIEALSDLQLTEVLKYLLSLESRKKNLLSVVQVSLKIDVADGGEDGRIEWQGGPSNVLPFFPSRKVLFQCKATDMPPGKCREEILASDGSVKTQVAKVLKDPEGSYVLFHSKALNRLQIDNRIEKFREALRFAGKTYANSAKITVLDANAIMDWVNQHISAVLLIYQYQGIPKPIRMKTWAFWCKAYFKKDFNYIPSARNQKHIATIRLCTRQKFHTDTPVLSIFPGRERC